MKKWNVFGIMLITSVPVASLLSIGWYWEKISTPLIVCAFISTAIASVGVYLAVSEAMFVDS